MLFVSPFRARAVKVTQGSTQQVSHGARILPRRACLLQNQGASLQSLLQKTSRLKEPCQQRTQPGSGQHCTSRYPGFRIPPPHPLTTPPLPGRGPLCTGKDAFIFILSLLCPLQSFFYIIYFPAEAKNPSQ